MRIISKSVQLIELHAFAYCLLSCFLIGIISLPRRLSPLNINELYLYGTNMDAYNDRQK